MEIACSTDVAMHLIRYTSLVRFIRDNLRGPDLRQVTTVNRTVTFLLSSPVYRLPPAIFFKISNLFFFFLRTVTGLEATKI